MSEEELLEEIKRHIDYTNAMNEKSLRDLQIENLYNLLQQKENIIKEVREYITKQVHRNQQFYEMDIDNILEILDKEVN